MMPLPRLSVRLTAIAEMVTPGSRVCDVGCDHALTSIYLVRSGRARSALAMDVAEGPLRSAEGNLSACGCRESVELRLSDGLASFRAGEADSLILSGMGGLLMVSILSAFPEKTASFRELILGPQREFRRLREKLRELGLMIREERMIEEDGRFYPLLRVSPGERSGADAAEEPPLPQRIRDEYGPRLLAARDPALRRYLLRQKRIYEEVRARLEEGKLRSGQESEAATARREEVHRELSDIGLALGYCSGALRED